MSPTEIARSYDQLALHWSEEGFDQNNGVAQHRRAFQFVLNRGAAIDLGCGSSGRLLALMIEAGFEVEGLDVSGEMIRLARLKHPSVVFHHADVRAWEMRRKYDFISAWDSIWHVPLAAQEELLKKLCAGLAAGGVLIFTSGGVDVPGEVTTPCMGKPMYHAALGIPKLLEIMAQAGCVCRHLEYDQHPEMHLYLIVQKAIHP